MDVTLKKKLSLYRSIEVWTPEGCFNVEYKGWGIVGSVYVQGQLADRQGGTLWVAPTFNFKIGSKQAGLTVSVWPWLAFKSFMLRIDNQVVYSEISKGAAASLLETLFSILSKIMIALVVVIFFAYPTIMATAAWLIALVDIVFLGRFGVAFIGGLIIAGGTEYFVRKKYPKWYVSEWLEGQKVWLALIWIGAGSALWLLRGDAPSLASGTEQVLVIIEQFFKNIPWLAWLFRSPCE